MSEVRDLRGASPLVVIVAAATALVVLVCAIAAGAMLLGGESRAAGPGAAASGAPVTPAVTPVSRDEGAGRPAPDEATTGASGTALELAAAAVTGVFGSSTCEDVTADATAVAAAITGLGDPGTWISRGVLDGAMGRPVEKFAESCGSVHAAAVVAALGLPDDVTGPLAAYVANGGARSSVDATDARDKLAVGVPEDLLVGASATRSVGQFMLPSGNIACGLGGGGARCEIADADFGTDPAGACAGRWGGLISVGAGVGEPGCLEGWSALGSGTVLRYGESTRVDGFSCAVSTAGVACRNDATGHGFWLRSSEFRVF
ncbi:hypothetical protein [Sanguibacter sp. HDW7]|uniref:hypothetical protein n=1 Tax=Sanguibacter sp. HDW7 TaxID=2714931 RepID=UPI00140B59D8|nr:hypothetical protein [Sanguibacter sp. HDW7]QIK83737.1 hypothetical protein G7063_08935 [Sanguibacter sp. HDW7]